MRHHVSMQHVGHRGQENRQCQEAAWVVSYAVSQRTAEIGVRMALGATGADVSRLVVVQGLKPAIVGVGIGVVVALFASRVLRTLLFGVTPIDPLTFAIVPAALLVVAALACYVPAVRAVHLDPTQSASRRLRGIRERSYSLLVQAGWLREPPTGAQASSTAAMMVPPGRQARIRAEAAACVHRRV